MAAQYKTRCPHCGAQFRIREEHLRQAKGKVRCGSCLEVFLATRNLIDDQDNPTPPQQHSGGQQDRQTDAPEHKQPDEDKKRDYIPSNDTAVSLGSSELSDTFIHLDEEGDESDHAFPEIGGGGDTDESWAEQLLEELEGEQASSKDRGKPAEPPSAPPPPDSMSLLDEWGEEDDEPAETAAEPADSGTAIAEDDRVDDFDLFRADTSAADDDELDFVEIEALEKKPARKLTLPARPSLGLQWLKWAALSLLALAVLGGQHLAFNFSELARQPDWRPLYTQICDVLGCQLPQRANIDKLRGANLVVRSHPRVADALVVDAIIFNEAKYPQPFPQLELTFSSLEEKPVASRRFQPSEYRAGELAELEHMPPRAPIHVSLEILDPGPEAVNYSLSFHLPATDNAGSGERDPS